MVHSYFIKQTSHEIGPFHRQTAATDHRIRHPPRSPSLEKKSSIVTYAGDKAKPGLQAVTLNGELELCPAGEVQNITLSGELHLHGVIIQSTVLNLAITLRFE